MTTFWRVTAVGLVLLGGVEGCHGMELTVSRQALERTLKQQLFGGPDGRYYLKGNAQSGCFISTEDPHLILKQDRIVVRVRTRARLRKDPCRVHFAEVKQQDFNVIRAQNSQ